MAHETGSYTGGAEGAGQESETPTKRTAESDVNLICDICSEQNTTQDCWGSYTP